MAKNSAAARACVASICLTHRRLVTRTFLQIIVAHLKELSRLNFLAGVLLLGYITYLTNTGVRGCKAVGSRCVATAGGTVCAGASNSIVDSNSVVIVESSDKVDSLRRKRKKGNWH